MGEVGCLKDVKCQNLEVSGSVSSKVNVVALTLATTISTDQSGTVFTLDSAGGAYDVTLPTVASASGCIFRFVCAENTPTADITISSNAANIVGVLHVQSDTNEDNLISVTGHTDVLFDTTALIGDWIELIGNGTNYFVKGQGSVQGAFTIA
jgi:hypothetical protein